MARANGIDYGASVKDLADQSASKEKEIRTVVMRITENDLKNSGYEQFLTEAGTTITVDPDTEEIL